MPSRSEVRRQLEAEIEPDAILASAWRALQGDAHLHSFEMGRGSFDAVVGRYWQLVEALAPALGARGRGQSAPVVANLKPDDRYGALLSIVFRRLNADPEVEAFRKDHWPGACPTIQGLAMWMVAQADKEPATESDMQQLTLPALDAGSRYNGAWVQIGGQEARLDASTRSLTEPVYRVTFCRGGELDRLRHLAERWRLPGSFLVSPLFPDEVEGAAVLAVACGLMRGAPMAKAMRQSRSSLPPEADVVTLIVNVRTPPRDVVRLYEELRSLGGRGRDHAMQKKHLELADYGEQVRQSGATWPDSQRCWNGAHPEWEYPEDAAGGPRRFARDCRAAWARVTGEEWTEVAK